MKKCSAQITKKFFELSNLLRNFFGSKFKNPKLNFKTVNGLHISFFKKT
jgi:hypothetical protein